MMIEFLCPVCRKRLTVSEDKAGKKGKCPNCGQPIRSPFPNAGTTVRSQPVKEESPPASYVPASGIAGNVAYGDEVYEPGFNLQAVGPNTLKAWSAWRTSHFSAGGAVALNIVTCG